MAKKIAAFRDTEGARATPTSHLHQRKLPVGGDPI